MYSYIYIYIYIYAHVHVHILHILLYNTGIHTVHHYTPITSPSTLIPKKPAFPSGHWTGPTSEHRGHHAKEPILGTSKSSDFQITSSGFRKP